MTKKFLIAAPLALAAGALLVTPASAASFSNPGQIRAEIQQLDRQVDRAHGRDAQRLQARVDRLQSLYQSYARGGFSRNELQRLDRELGAVKAQVYSASRDRNGFDGGRDQRGDRYDNNRYDYRGDRNDHRR